METYIKSESHTGTLERITEVQYRMMGKMNSRRPCRVRSEVVNHIITRFIIKEEDHETQYEFMGLIFPDSIGHRVTYDVRILSNSIQHELYDHNLDRKYTSWGFKI